jgi:hypothetical protein
MDRPRWALVPYYYFGPLSKVSAPTKLPHKLGYIPKYLQDANNKEKLSK